MPNYLGGGPDFVVAKNGGGVGGLAQLGSMGRLATHLAVQKHLISHRADEQIRVQEAGNQSRAKWGVVANVANGQFLRQETLDSHDAYTERYKEDHPDVVSGKIKRDKDGNLPYTRPDLARQLQEAGLQEAKRGGMTLGPVAQIRNSQQVTDREKEYWDNKLKSDEEARIKKKEAGGPKPTFQPGPITKGSGGNPLLIQPKEGEFQGYTPRKTGTGGYDEALKSGAIDQDTYDSYLEDSKKPGKDYMPKNESQGHDARVKDNNSRGKSFDIGSSEHIANVDTAWGDGKLSSTEAADLSAPGSPEQKKYNEYPQPDTDTSIQEDHSRAGLDDKKGTEY